MKRIIVFDLDGTLAESKQAVDPEMGELLADLGGLCVEPLEDLLQFPRTAVEALLQQSINDGRLLLIFEIFGLDDPVEDACVGFSLMRGSGSPLVGTDGLLLTGQTFDLDPDLPTIELEDQAINSGRLLAQPVDLDLPISFFDTDLIFQTQQGVFQVDLHEDGSFSGFMAGPGWLCLTLAGPDPGRP